MQFISNCPVEHVRTKLKSKNNKYTLVTVALPPMTLDGLDVQIVSGGHVLGMIINLLPPRVQFRGKLFTINNNQTMLEGEMIYDYKLYQRFWKYILFFISMFIISGLLIHPDVAIFIIAIAWIFIGHVLQEWIGKVRGIDDYVDAINNALAETFEEDCV